MYQRDPLPGREAGLLPLERLVEVHTVVQLGVIIMRAGIEQEGLSSTDFPRITNVAKSGLQKSTGQGQGAPFGLHQGQQGFGLSQEMGSSSPLPVLAPDQTNCEGNLS